MLQTLPSPPPVPGELRDLRMTSKKPPVDSLSQRPVQSSLSSKRGYQDQPVATNKVDSSLRQTGLWAEIKRSDSKFIDGTMEHDFRRKQNKFRRARREALVTELHNNNE
jgi:hypothetical protein